jgi:hypothetical protein
MSDRAPISGCRNRHPGLAVDIGPGDRDSTFRGELAAQADHGISWTTDRKTATRYSAQWLVAGEVVVLRARAPFGSVLAQFSTDREVVVDTASLLEVRPVIGPTAFSI